MGRYGLAIVAAALLGAGAARAADPAAVQAPIQPQGVLQKGRTGPDGWSIAPQTRNEDPAGKPGATKPALNSRPGPNTAAKLPPGQDPGTPASQTASGPGTADVKAPK